MPETQPPEHSLGRILQLALTGVSLPDFLRQATPLLFDGIEKADSVDYLGVFLFGQMTAGIAPSRVDVLNREPQALSKALLARVADTCREESLSNLGDWPIQLPVPNLPPRFESGVQAIPVADAEGTMGSVVTVNLEPDLERLGATEAGALRERFDSFSLAVRNLLNRELVALEREQLQTLAHGIPNGATFNLTCQPNGTPLSLWMSDGLHIAGSTSDQSLAHDPSVLFPHIAGFTERMVALASEPSLPRRIEFEAPYIGENGEWAWIRIQATADHLPGSTTLNLRGIVQDHTAEFDQRLEVADVESTLQFERKVDQCATGTYSRYLESGDPRQAFAEFTQRLREAFDAGEAFAAYSSVDAQDKRTIGGYLGSGDAAGSAEELERFLQTRISGQTLWELARDSIPAKTFHHVPNPRDRSSGNDRLTLLATPVADDQLVLFGLAHNWTLTSRTLEELLRPLLATVVLIVNAARARQQGREDPRRLQSAIAEVKQANDAKTELLSRIGDELRTRMGMVVDYSQLLSREINDEWHVSHIEDIQKAAEHLLRVVDEILAPDDLDQEVEQPTIVGLDITKAIQKVARLMMVAPGKFGTRPIEVTSEIPEETLVQVDVTWLKRILAKLLSNTVNNSAPDSTVIIRLFRALGEGVRIEITSTGPGKPSDEMALATKPFAVADDMSDDSTDLELASTERMVKQMGGAFGSEGTPATATAYWFELPT